MLILPVEADLLLRRHRAAEFGWCDRDMLEVDCMELESFSRIGVHAPAARYCPLLAGLHFATWLFLRLCVNVREYGLTVARYLRLNSCSGAPAHRTPSPP